MIGSPVAREYIAAVVERTSPYVERLLESEGRELFNLWAFGGNLENQWRYMHMDNCIPMLADTGAHVGILIDADSPTFLLSDLTRKRDVYTLPEAVHRITGKSAQVLGLKQRGEVRVVVENGYHTGQRPGTVIREFQRG